MVVKKLQLALWQYQFVIAVVHTQLERRMQLFRRHSPLDVQELQKRQRDELLLEDLHPVELFLVQ